MSRLIGSAKVSTRAQNTDSTVFDLMVAGVRREDLYVDAGIPRGSLVFAVMAALVQMELELDRDRVNSSTTKRRDAGRTSAATSPGDD